MTRETRASRQRLGLARVDPGKAIRRARWHSHLVRHVRLAIVVICAFAIISVAIIAIFDPFKRLPGKIAVGKVGLKGTLMTMTAPEMKGMRPNGRPFALTGVSGTQNILNPNVVKLYGVNAKLVMNDWTTAKITARRGVYDSGKSMIWLKGHVRILNDTNGYDMRMASATVDIKSNALKTKKPVVVFLNGGKIAADSMDIEQGGDRISFSGDVRSVVDSRIQVSPKHKSARPKSSTHASAAPAGAGQASTGQASAGQAGAGQAGAGQAGAGQASAGEVSADQAEAAR